MKKIKLEKIKSKTGKDKKVKLEQMKNKTGKDKQF